MLNVTMFFQKYWPILLVIIAVIFIGFNISGLVFNIQHGILSQESIRLNKENNRLKEEGNKITQEFQKKYLEQSLLLETAVQLMDKKLLELQEGISKNKEEMSILKDKIDEKYISYNSDLNKLKKLIEKSDEDILAKITEIDGNTEGLKSMVTKGFELVEKWKNWKINEEQPKEENKEIQ